MTNGSLSQEEIDRLMKEALATPVEEAAGSENLTQMEQDIIGEVGNITMSQAATTMSELLGKKVLITTPRVETCTVKEILSASNRPKVVTSIEFKKGIVGSNMLLLDVGDSVKIANLMMGGDGEVESDTLTELELSAVGEAMNQMIGAASTAMATMLSKIIDIYPPHVTLWKDQTELAVESLDLDSEVCQIYFHLEVEGVLSSTIMQIFSLDAVHDITEIMLGDEAVVVERPQKKADEQMSKEEQVTEERKVSVAKPEFQQLQENGNHAAPKNLDLIMDVPLEFSVVLGESKKTIRDILSLGTGSVVELDKMTEEPLGIYVNGKLIAEGEVVVINENFGIRITNILSQEQRLSKL